MGSHRMNLEQWAALILGGGGIGSIVAWLTSRHKPKVDTAQVVLTGSDNLINQLQEERNRLDERITAVEKSAATRIDEVSRRADAAESRAAEAERNATYLAADMARITDHHLAVIRGVAAGTVPPWPPVPKGQNWLTDADYPPVITPRHHDTGTPGVDLNPPPEPED